MSGHWIMLNDIRVRVDRGEAPDPLAMVHALQNLFDAQAAEMGREEEIERGMLPSEFLPTWRD